MTFQRPPQETMTALFTDEMTLRQVDPDVYPGVYEGSSTAWAA
jgi:hypothetical protein